MQAQLLRLLVLILRRRGVEVERRAGGRRWHALRLDPVQRVFQTLLHTLQLAARGLRGGDDVSRDEARRWVALHHRWGAHDRRVDVVNHATEILRLNAPPREYVLEHRLATAVQLQLVNQLAQQFLALADTLLLCLITSSTDHGDTIFSAYQVFVLVIHRIFVNYDLPAYSEKTIFLDNPQILHNLLFLCVFQ